MTVHLAAARRKAPPTQAYKETTERRGIGEKKESRWMAQTPEQQASILAGRSVRAGGQVNVPRPRGSGTGERMPPQRRRVDGHEDCPVVTAAVVFGDRHEADGRCRRRRRPPAPPPPSVAHGGSPVRAKNAAKRSCCRRTRAKTASGHSSGTYASANTTRQTRE